VAYAPDIHVAVYQLLDDVMASSVPPPGAKAMIHSVIDDLHAARAQRTLIGRAEAISIQLHVLESAIIRADSDEASEARLTLRKLAAEWLDRRIRN
jgi:hypothetical protein